MAKHMNLLRYTQVDIHMYIYVCERNYMVPRIDNACLRNQKANDVRNHVKPPFQSEYCEDCLLPTISTIWCIET